MTATKPLAYEDSQVDFDPAKQTARFDSDADAYVISGRCPRCGDPISDDVIAIAVDVIESPAAEAKAPGVLPPPPASILVWSRVFLRSCDCDAAHLVAAGASGTNDESDTNGTPGQKGARPEGKRGCGAWWAMKVTPAAVRGRDPVVTKPTADEPLPTFHDQEVVEDAVDKSLAQIRGTAEKWRNALAGIAGLSGTYLVLKGVTDAAKSPEAAAIMLCGLGGLICGAAGAFVAADAAIGTPTHVKAVGAGDAARMQLARLRLANAAGSRINLAMGLTLAAFSFLLLALALTYVPTPEDEAQLMVTTQDREHPVCGTPSAGARNTIIIDRGDGDRVEIPIRSITSMKAVTSCD